MSDSSPETGYLKYKHFVVKFPKEYEYVAHVEINRPQKLNAFIEEYVF